MTGKVKEILVVQECGCVYDWVSASMKTRCAEGDALQERTHIPLLKLPRDRTEADLLALAERDDHYAGIRLVNLRIKLDLKP